MYWKKCQGYSHPLILRNTSKKQKISPIYDSPKLDDTNVTIMNEDREVSVDEDE